MKESTFFILPKTASFISSKLTHYIKIGRHRVHKYQIAAYLTKFYDKLKKFSAGNSWKITVAGVMDISDVELWW